MREVLAGLRADLVGRRLWPLVVLLLAAVVAVPVVLGRDGGETAAGAPADAPAPVESGAGGGAALHAARSALRERAGSASRAGLRDPFARPARRSRSASAPRRAATATVSEPATTSPKPQAAPAPDPAPAPASPAPATSAPAPRATAPRSAPPPSPSRAVAAVHVLRHPDIRFGAREHRDVARLAAFPSARAPVVQFLGVTPAGRAAFAVAPGTTVEGDAACRPSRIACTQIVLARGQRAFLTAGATRQSLKLLRVRTTRTRSAARARRFYARVSQAGRCLRNLTQSFEFDARTGTLAVPVRPKAAAACRYEQQPAGTVTLR